MILLVKIKYKLIFILALGKDIDYYLNGVFGDDIMYFLIYFKKGKENFKNKNNYIETNQFFLKHYKSESSNNISMLLIRLENEYTIDKKALIMISDIYIQINISDQKIELIRLGNKNKVDKKIFSFSVSDSPITIGRHKSCKLILDHDSTLHESIQLFNITHFCQRGP